MHSRRRRPPARPAIERLEGRDLPSVAPIYFARAAQARRQAVAADVPTPHEQHRRAFFAAFAGRYVLGPGRTSGQAAQIYISGGGNSSAFLHGDLQLALFVPADPAAPVTGQAALFVKNVSNTGSVLVLDLAEPTPAANPGRVGPRLMTWTVDSSSAGTFSGATGQGTVQLNYRPGGRLPTRATGAGSAGAIFRGQVNTVGIFNITRI